MTMTDADATGRSQRPFRILTVCTGNICRSPMAERLLQAGLDERFPAQFAVESAGTGALVGHSVDTQVAGFIREYGASAENFAARQLTAEILQGQDLVLALTREHRSRVVEMAPTMLRKTFTLREFARILPVIPSMSPSASGPDRWRAILPKAVRARANAAPSRHADDDVSDPFRRSAQEYRDACMIIGSDVRAILGASQWD
jgi:protein-tyrosine phosphatase